MLGITDIALEIYVMLYNFAVIKNTQCFIKKRMLVPFSSQHETCRHTVHFT